jgi:hypothetical protein
MVDAGSSAVLASGEGEQLKAHTATARMSGPFRVVTPGAGITGERPPLLPTRAAEKLRDRVAKTF